MASALLYCDTCGAANPSQAASCFFCGTAMSTPVPFVMPPAVQMVYGYLLKQRYRILDLIGKGGFGVVYQAADILFGNRLVAIKEMSQSGLNPQELLAATVSFQREAHMLVDLSHSNLPRIYDQFAEGRRWYLVMDFIEGQTLEELLNITNQPLPLEQVLYIGIELSTVLNYLHTRYPPIIFRDLKPSNIMLTPGEHLYLIDFGIARHFKPGQTKDTVAFGTLGYAAPEQFGKAQTTPRTDIYSLGAILHQLITGNDPSVTPFRFASLYTSSPSILARLEPIIMQMVEIDESKRPDSTAIVKQELQRIVALHAAKKTKPPQPLVGGRQLGLTLYTYRGHTDRVNAIAWSPDGTYVASGSEDNTVQIWDVNTKSAIFIYSEQVNGVHAIAWSPDGKYVASGSGSSVNYGADNTVRIWDSTTGHTLYVYRGHQGPVLAVAWTSKSPLSFSGQGSRIASGSKDGTVQIWQAM